MHSLLLMERIAVSLSLNEPILLVGETGTGKTTVVQYLAQNMGQRLIVLVCLSCSLSLSLSLTLSCSRSLVLTHRVFVESEPAN